MIVEYDSVAESGPAAIAVYGVCCCQKATLLNQVWLLDRSHRLSASGSVDILCTVRCGLCGRPRGADR